MKIKKKKKFEGGGQGGPIRNRVGEVGVAMFGVGG